jgi:hypothetical protein
MLNFTIDKFSKTFSEFFIFKNKFTEFCYFFIFANVFLGEGMPCSCEVAFLGKVGV